MSVSAYGSYSTPTLDDRLADTATQIGVVLHVHLDSRPGVVDVSADGLTLAFAPTPGMEVVATDRTTIDVGSGLGRLTVVAEVLGASHRVQLFDGARHLATEQVACLGGRPTRPLPSASSHDTGRCRLDFRSERWSFDDDALDDLATRLCDSGGDAALVVSFPGHASALTSISVLGDGWESWHLYPGDDAHAVRTRTVVVAP